MFSHDLNGTYKIQFAYWSLIPLLNSYLYPYSTFFFHIKSENLTVLEREICCAWDYQKLYGTSTHRITKSMEFIFKDYPYIGLYELKMDWSISIIYRCDIYMEFLWYLRKNIQQIWNWLRMLWFIKGLFILCKSQPYLSHVRNFIF